MQRQPFRMLTVWQPWADFLVADDDLIAWVREVNPELAGRLPKDVENRGKGTPWCGTLLVHAGKEVDLAAMERFGLDPARFVTGAVVGLVRLVDVVTDSPSWWAQPGRKHWRTTDQRRLASPVHCVGFQGAREPEPAVLASVLSQVAHQGLLVAGT